MKIFVNILIISFCSRPDGGALPIGEESPIFANFIKKFEKLYKKNSSIYQFFKIQYIFLYIFIYIYLKIFFDIYTLINK